MRQSKLRKSVLKISVLFIVSCEKNKKGPVIYDRAPEKLNLWCRD